MNSFKNKGTTKLSIPLEHKTLWGWGGETLFKYIGIREHQIFLWKIMAYKHTVKLGYSKVLGTNGFTLFYRNLLYPYNEFVIITMIPNLLYMHVLKNLYENKFVKW